MLTAAGVTGVTVAALSSKSVRASIASMLKVRVLHSCRARISRPILRRRSNIRRDRCVCRSPAADAAGPEADGHRPFVACEGAHVVRRVPLAFLFFSRSSNTHFRRSTALEKRTRRHVERLRWNRVSLCLPC